MLALSKVLVLSRSNNLLKPIKEAEDSMIKITFKHRLNTGDSTSIQSFLYNLLLLN